MKTDNPSAPLRELTRVPEAEEARPAPGDAVIEAWFNQRIANSVVSRNTTIFNYVRAEVDDLKRRLKQES